ncbi:MAG: hypothetical protein ACHP8A_06185 [Terriglobales bacterium]|jgi:hypothetical protein|nr:hypothetical protein [Terriglobales bacterium]
MKTSLLFAIFLACATAAFGQNYGPALTSSISLPDHPEHAQRAPMAREQNLWGSESPYTFAKGELPLSEFARASAAVPLGDVARNYRKEHASVKKAVIVWAN